MKAAASIRCAEKANVDLGSWTRGKRMPKTAFRLRKPYPVPRAWVWRIISFECAGEPYKVLLKARPERHDFMAMLVHDEGEPTVLCRVEHHGSHPGWHIHYQAERPFSSGVVVAPHMRKRRCGQDVDFGPSVVSQFDAWAVTFAAHLFGLRRGGEDENGLGIP